MRSNKGAEHIPQAAGSDDYQLESDMVKEGRNCCGDQKVGKAKRTRKVPFWNQQDVIVFSMTSEKNNILIKM